MRLVSSVVALFVAHGAWAAVWTGGASGTLDDAANWEGDIATSAMMFKNDVTVTLSANTTAYQAFSDSTAGNADTERFNRNVVFNLNGHTLWTTSMNNSGTHYWRTRGSTFTFRDGTFKNIRANGVTTNSVCLDHGTLSYGTTLIATGSGTEFISSYESRGLYGSNPGTSFKVLDGAAAYGNTFVFGGTHCTNEVSGGSSLSFNTALLVGGVGTANSSHSNNYGIHDVLLSVTGGGTRISGKDLDVGHGFNRDKTGYENGNRDNAMLVGDGAVVTVSGKMRIGSYGPNTNNVLTVTGAETTLFATSAYVGVGNDTSDAVGAPRGNALIVTDGASAAFSSMNIGYGSAASADNRLEISGGATCFVNGTTIIGRTGTNNTLLVKSGAIMTTAANGVGYFGTEGTSFGSHIEVDGGTLNISNQVAVGKSGYAVSNVIDVVNGGTFWTPTINMNGSGDMLSVSNGIARFTTLNTGAGAASDGNVIRVAGSSSVITFATWQNQQEYPHGAPVFEFLIPEGGWAAAPITCDRAFSLPANVTLRIDEASVKAYKNGLKAQGQRRGTVPLMKTGATNRAITVADMAALSVNLPDGCTLVCENGVLSVEIKAVQPMILIIR
jgi:hypothetical protein